jgi:hypothetical protein
MAERSPEGKAPDAEASDATVVAAQASAATAATAAAMNPATRKMITDLALRGGAFLARKLIDKRLTGMQYTPKQASEILAGRGLAKAAATAAVTRLGFKSLPGSMLIGGVVLAKTLLDRKRARAAKKAARK